jgi:hypothetical protein
MRRLSVKTINSHGIKWIKGRHPTIPLGSDVWVYERLRSGKVYERRLSKTKLIGYNCTIQDCDGHVLGVVNSYKLMLPNKLMLLKEYGEYGDGGFYPGDVFALEKEALEATKFYPVKATGRQWMKAIGLKKGAKRSDYDDDCELQPCCANVSSIRDMLALCMEDGGLIARDVNRLGEMLTWHEGGGKEIEKILGQLGLKWVARANKEEVPSEGYSQR